MARSNDYELEPVRIYGVDLTITVSPAGEFHGEYQGDDYMASSLSDLTRRLAVAIASSRTEVPFISQRGRHGVLRGYHAGNHDVLVTWSNGDKDRLSPHEKVFVPGEVTEAELEQMENLRRVVQQANDAIRDIEAKAEHRAAELLSEALGVPDVTRMGRS